jgi:hypothetical protein
MSSAADRAKLIVCSSRLPLTFWEPSRPSIVGLIPIFIFYTPFRCASLLPEPGIFIPGPER